MSYVDATPAREHILQLVEWGMKQQMIADATGGWVTHSTVHNLQHGHYERILAATEADLLVVTPHPHPNALLALSVGAQRRIRALQRRGWSMSHLEDYIGLHSGACDRIMRRRRISRDLWQKIADAYEPLSASEDLGPSSRTLAYAIKNKWPAPLDWETADIDHPDSWPEPAVNRDGDYESVVIRRERVAELTRVGWSSTSIAAHLRVAERTVERDRNRLRVGVDGDHSRDAETAQKEVA